MSTKVNLGLVFAEIGMSEKVGKSQATRLANKAGVVVENGLMSVEDFLTVTATYEDENNTSKYAKAMIEVRAAVKAGNIKDAWTKETITVPKGNAFTDAKVLKAVIAYAENTKNAELLEFIGTVKAEIEAAAKKD